jgi:dTDP-4-amino-4,6-dideoxygalactose transaminase
MQFLDLKKQYQSIKGEVDLAIKQVLESGAFIGGEEVEQFEAKVAEFCKVKYAIGVNSGTDALFLSLKALGIGAGDEVITTPFTFIATAGAIVNCGAKPVFVDIDPETFNIDSSEIEGKITKNTKAIIPVHLFGQMADMDEILEIAKKHRLYVIEDACQAMGAQYQNQKAGTLGDLGCFSFFPTKNLGAYGDGGMVVTNNEKLAGDIRLLKNHGSSPKEKYLNLIIGTNSRLDAIQAAILRVKLKYLSQWSKKRLEKASYYGQNLREVGDIITPFISKDKIHIFHQYTIRTNSRDALVEFLKEEHIPVTIYYPISLHLQPALKYLGYKEGDFPVAETAAKEVLSLPIYPELEEMEQEIIVKNIGNFFRKK